MRTAKIGIDVGGTFTDVVLLDEDGNLKITKVPSTPSNPSIGLLNGIDSILELSGASLSEVESIVHGTTVVTNLLLERNGAPTALLTTQGFRDVLEIGRQKRAKLYDLFQDKPQVLVPGRWRWEVTERISANGDVVTRLDEEAVLAHARRAVEEGIESIAVVFLHSYVNPQHERRAAELIRSVSPDLHVSLSCDVNPEFREFERSSTTVANAYAMPRVARYMTDVRVGLAARDDNPGFMVMQSNGGVTHPELVAERPVNSALSGPSGGVIGSAFAAGLAGISNVITMDMGGTSCDVAVILDGRPRMTTEGEIDGRPLRTQMVDMHTVGAGGGSIGWVDSGGALRVGPASAGADPGPACYGRGGTLATVTDANLVLGRIDPATFLGGRMRLDAAAAEEAVAALAAEAGLTVEETAAGIVRIAESNMMNAVRLVSLQRGYDPRDFVLMAFGGAGPLHAAAMARELRVPRVLVPLGSSALSALGCLVADIRHDYTSTRRVSASAVDPADIMHAFSDLEATGNDDLDREGVAREGRDMVRRADMRYEGQAYELTVPFPAGAVDHASIQTAVAAFHKEHERTYGHSAEGEPVEFVNLRVTAVAPGTSLQINEVTGAAEPESQAYLGSRPATFPDGAGKVDVWKREHLRGGNVIEGPALVEAEDTSILLLSGDRMVADGYGNLIIDINVEGLSSGDA
ncbi:hydantoinase/oxoprolinase family protein [Streptomyces sp. NPDC046821]|uniref:hydantoinase/oxoprolinase family protein n=1 Tax=Streptomyces sp. NPDC046821 TaxID=3154702 RepID=UPI0033FC48BA